jgi:hypothetical protein
MSLNGLKLCQQLSEKIYAVIVISARKIGIVGLLMAELLV